MKKDIVAMVYYPDLEAEEQKNAPPKEEDP